jgi:superfamily II DNA or RNA helicase
MTLALQTQTLFVPTKPRIQLRDDQKALKRELYDALKIHKRALTVAPCGWGKTVFFCQIIYDAAVKRQRRTLIVVPFTVLIEQTLETLEKFGLSAGVIAGNYREDRSQLVQIATTQTLSRGRDITWFNPEVILADEVHLSAYCQWFKDSFPNLKNGKQTTSIKDIRDELAVLGIAVEREDIEPYKITFEEAKEKYKHLSLVHAESKEILQEINSAWEIIRKQQHLFSGKTLPVDNRLVIGLTATPWRLSKREELGDIFEVQITGPTPKEMIERGALVGCVYFGTKNKINTKGVKINGGDFDASQLEIRCLEAVKSTVSEYRRLGQGRQFVCFAAGVEHAKSLCTEFNERGVPTAVITAETPEQERREIFRKVAELRLRGIVNINTCGIGFNLPAISCIIHARPTKSFSLYIQMTGRGQRLCSWLGKVDCLVLDQAGNVEINADKTGHGFIEDVEYPMLCISSDTKKGQAPTKECENCNKITYASARICPHCGYEFPTKEKKQIANERLEIIIHDKDRELYLAYKYALREAYKKGEHIESVRGWMIKTFKNPRLSKDWMPPKSWKLHAIFKKDYNKNDLNNYEAYLKSLCKIENNNWVKAKMAEEFGDGWDNIRL